MNDAADPRAHAARITALQGELALALRAACSREVARGWADGVLAAEEEWTRDFDDEQFSLGRAFYTHLEQDKLDEYFEDASDSDERVERAAPGLQAAMLEIVAKVTGASVVRRKDFCGPGVHVFPAGGKVALDGGVVHFDTEGLPARHIQARRPALSIVLMLAAPEQGGGLKLWNTTYAGADAVADEVLAQLESTVVVSAPGDVVVFDSYRLHQIQPFGGARARISATVHAAEVGPGRWETWF